MHMWSHACIRGSVGLTPPLERRIVGQFTPHSCDYLVELHAQNLNLRRVVDSLCFQMSLRALHAFE